MTAEMLVRALGGRRSGSAWMACCPAHDDRDPSLAIREGHDGKVLVRCHGGCSQWAVIRALAERGIWTPGGSGAPVVGRPSPKPPACSSEDSDRTALALRIWQESLPAPDTAVVTYLRSRGLTLPATADLRFHPKLKHPSGGQWPGMVALVVDGVTGTPTGIHRTFLARDGGGKAPVVPERMMLGPCRGGVVRLGPATDSVIVGEGVETCLAAMQSTSQPAWAALSASGLRSLALPQELTTVTVLADADDPGEAAAQAGAGRWAREGRRVRIARPPGGHKDFNDVLRREATAGRSA